MNTIYPSSDAIISPCGLYRYTLDRIWGPGTIALFAMLNPSTADAECNDPTIRRTISFAKREGCGGLSVVNLFAFRATKPKALLDADDPVGPENDNFIRIAMNRCAGPWIAAWGADKMIHYKGRALMVEKLLGHRAMCLGKTKQGHPGHPLYVPGDTPLQPLKQGLLV